MSVWNLPSVFDKYSLTSRDTGIFIKVEFGVTFSQRDDALETPKTYSLINKAESNFAFPDSAEEEDSDNEVLSSPYLSLPCLRPLDLSGPFDKDQEDLWSLQPLTSNNLSSSALQCHKYPNKISANFKSSTGQANNLSTLLETGEAILRAKDLGLFQQATLTVSTLFLDSENETDHENPRKQTYLDNTFNLRSLRMSSHFGRTLYAAQSYEIYRKRIAQWDNN
ncbi:hypothetical protein GcM1_171005 [Golovinomyces cichoracearum]|uniref:Uncharacterized protein n=1 Tax=Golovinomyces cichoracearum TaxID=62708 RepID=A0A420J6Q4_9PEZI|nr:hypothetical protein GcM1_171005 [Golovinomyces cichoracearum]